MRIKYDEMVSVFKEKLEKYGITGDDADLAAKLFADASADGVHTHGLQRFPKFIASIKNGTVDVSKRAKKVETVGFIERWDGQRGPGNLNAYICMDRAIELAKERGVGVVALRNTNHWMRPGNYGYQAVSKNCIAILWTNTVPNMPPWGAKEAKLGNNPLVIAVPHEPSPVIVDVAMSMFSYGKLEKYKREGLECPVDGGIDKDGNITRDPAKILETHQVLPIGYWKGSGLSLVLDLVASALSGGTFTREIGTFDTETSLSQLFIVFDLDSLPDKERVKKEIALTLADLDSSTPIKEGGSIHYPGEGMMATRKESMEKGVFADDALWKTTLEL